MDGFKTAVLGVAVSLLIIILAVVGVIMTSNSKNLIFPPTSLPCPNYWQMNSDGTCSIPIGTPAPQNIGNVNPQYAATYTAVNMGSLDLTKSTTTKGYNSSSGTVNFMDSGWGTSTGSATCAKKKWANDNGILWDGISNYNGCDQK